MNIEFIIYKIKQKLYYLSKILFSFGNSALHVKSVLKTPPSNLDKKEIINEISKTKKGFLLLKKDSPTVSAVFRVRNVEDTLMISLKSFSMIASEIVIIDNGSNDRTLEIVEKFKEESPDIAVKVYNYFHNIEVYGDNYLSRVLANPNGSIAKFYNFCFSKSSSQYLIKADASCVIMPYIVPLFFEAIKLQPKIIFTKGSEIFGREISFEPRVFKASLNLKYLDGEFWEFLDCSGIDVRAETITIYQPMFLHFRDILYN